MDDPWGSPWATTDNSNAPSATPSKTILEPPRPALLSTPSNLNLNLPSNQSPWADDDGFGDWASPDLGNATHASPWTWGNEAVPIEQLTPSYEPRRKSSTPKWPRSRSASPGLRAPITPGGASPGYLTSDPWANQASSFTKDDPEPIAHLPHIPDVPLSLADKPQLELVPDTPKRLLDESNTNEPTTLQFDGASPESLFKPFPFGNPIVVDQPQILAEQDDGPITSSESTTSGANEDDDGDLPGARHADSPITSIEDNPLPNKIRRKPSSKVQELVEMYDGIARRTTVTPERQIPPSTTNAATDDALASVLDSPDSKGKGLAAAQILPPSAEPVSEEPPDDGTDDGNEWKGVVRSTRPDHEPFIVDLGQVDSLVPGDCLEASLRPEDVPDRIIDDSFTEMSERKMWYRLSRHQSLRKYDAGDDDNYVRINWANSKMRDETMQIVRRWMEEDSMGGKAFRGGLAGKAGGQFFGWDSTTESTPVDLDRVFGRKPKRQAPLHRPTHSIGALPSLSTAPMVPSSENGTPASAQAKETWGGLATFGWSTGTADTKEPQEAKAPERTTFTKPLPLGFAGFDNTPKSHVSMPVFTSKPIIPTTPIIDTSHTKEVEKEEDEEDDDEWGDMVSPTTAEATDSTSLPKTSWDSFSTNSLPDSAGTAVASPSDNAVADEPKPDTLGCGNKPTEENKSGVRDIGNVIRPAPASTFAAHADVPQSQDGSVKPPAATYTFRPSSTGKRPPNISIAGVPNAPPAPSPDGKTGVSAGGLLDTPLTSGLGTPSTAQPRNSAENDDDFVQQLVRNLPDLSYMLK